MVIAIIAVIGSYILGVGQSSSQAALSARAAAELTTLSAALEAYRIVYGDYPRTADPAVLLQSLIGKIGPTGAVVERRSMIDVAHLSVSGDLDPFTTVTANVVDPWAQPYHYAYKSSAPWNQPGYVLFSGGPDQQHAPLLSGGSMDGASPENLDNIHLAQ